MLEHAVHLRAGTPVHSGLMRVLPFLTFGSSDKMTLIVGHFSDVTDFESFDESHGADEDGKMEAFVAMCDGIERNDIGNTMKNQMLRLGILEKCLEYIKVKMLRNQITYCPGMFVYQLFSLHRTILRRSRL